MDNSLFSADRYYHFGEQQTLSQGTLENLQKLYNFLLQAENKQIGMDHLFALYLQSENNALNSGRSNDISLRNKGVQQVFFHVWDEIILKTSILPLLKTAQRTKKKLVTLTLDNDTHEMIGPVFYKIGLKAYKIFMPEPEQQIKYAKTAICSKYQKFLFTKKQIDYLLQKIEDFDDPQQSSSDCTRRNGKHQWSSKQEKKIALADLSTQKIPDLIMQKLYACLDNAYRQFDARMFHPPHIRKNPPKHTSEKGWDLWTVNQYPYYAALLKFNYFDDAKVERDRHADIFRYCGLIAYTPKTNIKNTQFYTLKVMIPTDQTNVESNIQAVGNMLSSTVKQSNHTFPTKSKKFQTPKKCSTKTSRLYATPPRQNLQTFRNALAPFLRHSALCLSHPKYGLEKNPAGQIVGWKLPGNQPKTHLVAVLDCTNQATRRLIRNSFPPSCKATTYKCKTDTHARGVRIHLPKNLKAAQRILIAAEHHIFQAAAKEFDSQKMLFQLTQDLIASCMPNTARNPGRS